MILPPDVVALRRFYSSELGQCVRRDLGAAISRYWHDVDDLSIAGLGFSLPYLRQFLPGARRVVSVMFPHLGAMYWPADVSNHSLLAHESALPLKESSIARVLVCHGVEHSHHLASLMQEIYRILSPGGRALLVVPNRRGLWASQNDNPLAAGHPYNANQLKHRAELAGLTYTRATSALFYPPSDWRAVRRLSATLELLGRVFIPQLGGALLVEVEKQLYASIPAPKPNAMATPVLYPGSSVNS